MNFLPGPTPSCVYFFYQATVKLRLYCQTHYGLQPESLSFLDESFSQSCPACSTCRAYLRPAEIAETAKIPPMTMGKGYLLLYGTTILMLTSIVMFCKTFSKDYWVHRHVNFRSSIRKLSTTMGCDQTPLSLNGKNDLKLRHRVMTARYSTHGSGHRKSANDSGKHKEGISRELHQDSFRADQAGGFGAKTPRRAHLVMTKQ